MRILLFLSLPLGLFAQKEDSERGQSIPLLTASLSAINDSILNPNANTPAFEIVMDLKAAPLKNNSQGGACFENYYVLAVNNNSRFNLFDLRKQEMLCSIPVTEPTPNKYIHANTICFGNEFYDPSDEMPLLYVCSNFEDTITAQSHLYVYRLFKQNASNYKSQLIQDITLGVRGWTECVVDCEHSVLWVKRYNGTTDIDFLKFPIPDISLSKITLLPDAAIDRIKTYEIPIPTQGFLYHKDHIYAVLGVPSRNGICYLIDFNLETRDYERIVSLFDLGLVNNEKKHDNKWEPENIFLYQNELHIGYHSFICRLNWNNVINEHNYRTLFERVYKR